MLWHLSNPVSFEQKSYISSSSKGECNGYTVLFHDFVFLQNFLSDQSKPIDYSQLKSFLISFDPKQLTELSNNLNLSNLFGNKFGGLNEITILKENSPQVSKQLTYDYFDPSANTIKDFNTTLFNDIHAFKTPVFYQFNFQLKNVEYGHRVGFYLYSKKELHFFDADSGIHILELPDDINLDDLMFNIEHLLFWTTTTSKQIKWVKNLDDYFSVLHSRSFKYQPAQMYFSMITSFVPTLYPIIYPEIQHYSFTKSTYKNTTQLNKHEQIMYDLLETFASNPSAFNIDKLKTDSLIKDKEMQPFLDFLKRIESLLKTIQNKHTVDKNPHFSFFKTVNVEEIDKKLDHKIDSNYLACIKK